MELVYTHDSKSCLERDGSSSLPSGTSVMKSKILVILGPTATGKSSLAVSLAKKFNGEVISADSRQVYKGMNLGSGKIMKYEMEEIPHHLIDIVSPNTRFSVQKYKKLTERAIGKILAKNKLPIICGGTGFYIDSIIKNIELPEVAPNNELRKKLEKKSTEQLFKMLEKLSTSRAKNIDKYNKVRLIRAIEIAQALGNVPEIIEKPSKYDFILVGLDLADEKLKKNIAIRLSTRIKKGMVYEVKKLHKNRVSWKKLESFGLEYKNIALYLQSKISKEEMLKKLQTEIWHFAKRQRTWFKRNKDIKWFKPSEKINILKLIKNVYK